MSSFKENNWLDHVGISAVLAILWTVLAAAPSLAASAFDAAQSAATTSSGRTLAWTHTLGGGGNRVLVVGVSTEDNQSLDPGIVVRFGGSVMAPVPGGVAATGDRSGKDHGFLRTQLFYLLDSSLPGPGVYAVEVSLSRTVREIGGGCTSIAGLAQAAPEAVTAATAAQGATRVNALLDVATPHSWVVQAAGADVVAALAPVGAGQTVRYASAGRGVSVAGAADMAQAAGRQSIGWSVAAAGRAALVAAAFGPLRFPLAVAVEGRGSVKPGTGLYPDGVALSLDATAAAGHAFSAWTGDLEGAANPASLVMDGPKSVVAHFVPDFALVGWAATNGGTTGGEGGEEKVVDTLAQLKLYAESEKPYIIKIAGTILGADAVKVRSNKTILGIGSTARLLGVGLAIGQSAIAVRNVIVRNVTFEKAKAPLDGVAVNYGAQNVWIDHCNFLSDRDHGVDYYDGLLDISNASDFVTVSWCRFYDHYKSSLVGSGDGATSDAGHLTVTYHHNSFINSGGRNPSVRFGLVHVFDNYYRDIDDYGIASRMDAQVVIENNWFESVNRPIRADTSLSPVAGRVRGTETNVFSNCTANSILLDEATWLPPYYYPLDPVETVPSMVERWGGVGILEITGVAPAPTAPTISVQPASQTIEAGATVTLSVLVDGSWPFAYTWFKDDAVIAGATDAVLVLTNVQVSDVGGYYATIANGVGTATTATATLSLYDDVNGGQPGVFVDDNFSDGLRTNQALPSSSAWFTSSGSSNLTVPVGAPRYMVQAVSSTRTLLTYFTAPGKVVTLGQGQSLTFSFTCQFSGFDTAAKANEATFNVALLRSVPNPAGRVSADFASNNAAAFTSYTGFAAFTNARALGVDEPVNFYARTQQSPTLLNGVAAYNELPTGTPTPSGALAVNTPYRGTLTLQRSGDTVTATYSLVRASDGTVMMQHASGYGGAPMNAFDTVAFCLTKTSGSSNYSFSVTNIKVQRQ
jgi:pectate lyase